ncbi:MAG: hypothetical protein AAFX56_05530 [Pseudomonadota bacterium]
MCEAELMYDKLEAERPRVLNDKALALLRDLAHDKDKARAFFVRSGTHDKNGNLKPQYR